MTEQELDELISDCPRLYHMAEMGAWEGVKRNGLLSTSSLLDLYEIEGDVRFSIESQRRPANVSISRNGFPQAVVRDQIPMDDNGLKRALPAEISPKDWYEFLNKRVFFWLTEERLMRLKNARAYKNKTHEIIVLDTRSLVVAHKDNIMLCPINSGCTKPFPHPRDFGAFSRVQRYPYAEWKKKRKAGERVVELCVDDGVRDIENHVVDVYHLSATGKSAFDWR